MKFCFLFAMTAAFAVAGCSGEAPPAAEAVVAAPEPALASEYSFQREDAPDGEPADVLIATAGDVEHRIEAYGYRLGAVIIQEDLNSDASIDAIIAVHSGGNCCPADYFFVADKGAGQYSVTPIPDVYAWDDPVVLQEDGKPMVRFVSSNEGMHTDDYVETVHIFRFEGKQPVLVSQTESEELPALAELRSSAFEEEPVGVGRRSFGFDLNDDGVEDEITCSLWERWGRLNECNVVIEEGAAPILVDAPCKRLGVTDQVTHGMRNLVCDVDEILVFDPEARLYTQN